MIRRIFDKSPVNKLLQFAMLMALVICGCGQAKYDKPRSESSNSPARKLVTFDAPKDWDTPEPSCE
jgi:hypothetical protein